MQMLQCADCHMWLCCLCRQGYDRFGFNVEGFNAAGFDRFGFDKAGFDKEGFGTLTDSAAHGQVPVCCVW